MSRRVQAARGGHHHLAWESQPLVRSTERPRGHSNRMIVLVFVIGFLIGLVF